MNMKIFAFIFVLAVLTGCSGFDFDKSYKVSRTAADLMAQQKFQEMENLYSHDFKASETPEQRAEKYAAIMNAVGSIQKVEWMDSLASPVNTSGQAEYRYKMTCTNTTLITRITVIEDFGDYLVSSVSITQE